MFEMKTVLILVNNKTQKVQGYERTVEYLKDTLASPYGIEVINIDESCAPYRFSQYLFVVYWCMDSDDGAPKDLIAALVTYTVQGGSLLGFAQGVASSMPKEMQFMFCAKFTKNMEATLFEICALKTHQISAGLEPTETNAQCSAFSFDENTRLEKIAALKSQSETYPILWVNRYGLGRTAGFAAGTEADFLSKTEIQRLLRRTGLWLQGKI